MNITASSGYNDNICAAIDGIHDRELLLLITLIVLYDAKGVDPEAPLLHTSHNPNGIRYSPRNLQAP